MYGSTNPFAALPVGALGPSGRASRRRPIRTKTRQGAALTDSRANTRIQHPRWQHQLLCGMIVLRYLKCILQTNQAIRPDRDKPHTHELTPANRASYA